MVGKGDRICHGEFQLAIFPNHIVAWRGVRVLKIYEGMFLVSTGEANRDWDDLLAHIHGLLERHGAKVLHTMKWDERRLAYEVEKQSRGVYILVHFEAAGDAIQLIQRDCQLSRRILRLLITVDEDGVPEPEPEPELVQVEAAVETMETSAPEATVVEEQESPATQEQEAPASEDEGAPAPAEEESETPTTDRPNLE